MLKKILVCLMVVSILVSQFPVVLANAIQPTSALAGAVAIDSMWWSDSEDEDRIPVTITVNGGDISAFRIWEDVTHDGDLWEGNYHGQARSFYPAVTMPTEVQRLTFDLYTPVDIWEYEGVGPSPVRWYINSYGDHAGTITSHPGFGIFFDDAVVVDVNGVQYFRNSVEIAYNEALQLSFRLQTKFRTNDPIFIGNATAHYSESNDTPPSGVVAVEALWWNNYINPSDRDPISITVNGNEISAFRIWEDVTHDGAPWNDQYWGQHKDFEPIVASPEEVLLLTFDLYTPVAIWEYEGDNPAPVRWYINSYGENAGTLVSHPGFGIFFDTPDTVIVDVNGVQYYRNSVVISYDEASQLLFRLQTKFRTDAPVFIGNMLVHYEQNDIPTGSIPADGLIWDTSDGTDMNSVEIDINDTQTAAFRVWENVLDDGIPWQGTYYGQLKDFTIMNVVASEAVMFLTFDLYTSTDIREYTGDHPAPVRYGVWTRYGSDHTVVSHPNNSIFFGGADATPVSVNGSPYTRHSVVIAYENADELWFRLETKFHTDNPIFIANVMIHYDEITETELAPGIYGFTGEFPGSTMITTPLQPTPAVISDDQAGTVNPRTAELYTGRASNTTTNVGGGTWMQNPFRYVPNPANGPIENIMGLELTAFMPINLFRNNTIGGNAPFLRFDYTVRPLRPAFASGTNGAGLHVNTWLIPQGIVTGEWNEITAMASGTYNTTLGNIPEGPQPFEDYSFNFDERVYIDGVPYIQINFTINFSEYVSINKEEIIFTMSTASISFETPIYFANVAAIYDDEPFGGKATNILDLPDRIFMDGQESGINMSDFSALSVDLELPSTHRGTWSGHQSRLTVTDEGVFVTYVNKELNEAGAPFGEEDGYHWSDRRSVVFAMQPADCPNGDWVVLGQWNHNSSIPIIMSDDAGNVYVAMYDSDEDWPNRDYRPLMVVYRAGSWSVEENVLATPLEQHREERWGTFIAEYTSANISPDGFIYVLTVENDRGGSEKGYIHVAIFDTNTSEWTHKGKLWTGWRYGYAYLNFVQNDTGSYDIEIVAKRMERGDRVGYQLTGSFIWVYDAIAYWRISPDFTDVPVAGSSLPPAGHNGFEAVPHYITVVKENVLVIEDPADYGPGAYPRIFFSGTGDVFWDDNGDIHIFYSNDTIATIGRPMYHMLVRDGEIVFNNPLFDNPRTLVMIKDDAGSYFILEAGEGVPGVDSARLHQATVTEDTGWEFEQLGSFSLPEPLRIYGFSQAYNAGIAGHGDTIHMMYPIRGPLFLPQGGNQADEWMHFVLNLTYDQPVREHLITAIDGTANMAQAAVGTMVEITANPAPAGYKFSHWSATPVVTFGDVTDASTTFVMHDEAVTITAHFIALDLDDEKGGGNEGGNQIIPPVVPDPPANDATNNNNNQNNNADNNTDQRLPQTGAAVGTTGLAGSLLGLLGSGLAKKKRKDD